MPRTPRPERSSAALPGGALKLTYGGTTWAGGQPAPSATARPAALKGSCRGDGPPHVPVCVCAFLHSYVSSIHSIVLISLKTITFRIATGSFLLFFLSGCRSVRVVGRSLGGVCKVQVLEKL